MNPRDLANRMQDDGFKRETFVLPVEAARQKAREKLQRYLAGGYSTIFERWRHLDEGQIEVTMRRLPTAD